MLLPIFCHECRWPDGDDSKGTDEMVECDLSDDGIYSGKCSKGHQITSVLQNLKHEVLFESGAVAHLLGFHREAFTSFWVSMERFFEFATHVFLEEFGSGDEKRSKMWKAMENQSERQLGAFLALYLACREEVFPHNLEKLAAERNRVIHKGGLPTRTETAKFARAIFDIIESTTVMLINDHYPALDAVRMNRAGRPQLAAQKLPGAFIKRADGFVAPSVMLQSMMISSWRDAPATEVSFDDAIKGLRIRGHWYGHPELSPE